MHSNWSTLPLNCSSLAMKHNYSQMFRSPDSIISGNDRGGDDGMHVSDTHSWVTMVGEEEWQRNPEGKEGTCQDVNTMGQTDISRPARLRW